MRGAISLPPRSAVLRPSSGQGPGEGGGPVRYMRMALKEAARGIGRTSPNPRVGAVLVKNGRVIAKGYHSKAGAPHAEVAAIQAAGPQARGADLYTTLEPCDHYGRTPPCTDAILRAGVRRVICGTLDPNPLVNGRGARRLRREGVEVQVGLLEGEAIELNRPFFKFARTGLPWVTLKVAMSLDGKIATGAGESRWISGESSRRLVHQLRNQVDAVLIGANTALQDNPKLTTRLPGGRGRNPVRVVVDSHLRLPAALRLFDQRGGARTVIATLEPTTSRRAKRFTERGVDLWSVPSQRGRVRLRTLLKRMAREGLLHVMVEGGAQLYNGFLSERLADELVLFVAPKLIGAEGLTWTGPLRVRRMRTIFPVSELTIEPVGDDMLIHGTLNPQKG